MDLDYLLIIACLILSAFFSSAETAFFSLSKFQLKKMAQSGKASHKRILKLLRYPRRLLITILLGNTVVNIAAASAGAGIALKLAKSLGRNPEVFLVAEVLIMTVLLLIIGEITPKLFAFAKSETIASFSSLFIRLQKYAFYPIVIILERISLLFTKDSVLREDPGTLTKEDFENLLNSDSSASPLEENEREIIKSIFKFPSISVRDIMIPRVDVVAVDAEEDMESTKQKILDSGHSRIPVYKNSIDEVIGFIYAKDLILNEEKKTVSELLRNPMFVTENMKIEALLNQFKAKKIHIAVVVDEYGGTAGLISMEDILEELVGEIMDEYDDEEPEKIEISKNEFLLSGMVSTRDLNEDFHLDLDEEEYENLAAFLYDEFNHVPKKGEKLIYKSNFTFEVKSIKGQRIDRVKLYTDSGEEA